MCSTTCGGERAVLRARGPAGPARSPRSRRTRRRAGSGSDGTPGHATPGDRPTSRTLRHTPVVRAVVEAAAGPVRCDDLIRAVEARFPGAPDGAVAGLVAQLIVAEVLLTELRPPLPSAGSRDGAAPARHACHRMGRRTALVPGRLPPHPARRGEVPPGAGHLRVRPRTESPGLPRTPGPRAAGRGALPADAVQVDLRREGTAVLSDAVAEELERAGAAPWRLSPPGPGRLPAYHQDFVERYGLGRLVPVKEVLDPDIGLGPRRPATGCRRVTARTRAPRP
ncbi:lantibiotic dehydratase [Streptomyces sp. NPDC007172]|uniref:lantibiotic dehydratase n=1 Tax=Streptomyces sp. NPDC007172 TaxID=3364776 RepID=UPI00367483F8